MPVFELANVGEDGLSVAEVWTVESIEEAELEYLKWPRLEKVGVRGEGISATEEV